MNAEEVKLREKMIAESRKSAEKEEGFWVGSHWLQEWMIAEIPSELPPNINQEITCPHDQLTLDRKARRTVTSDLWSYLYERFPQSTVYPYTQKTCSACQKLFEEEKAQELKEIEKRNQERVRIPSVNLLCVRRLTRMFLCGRLNLPRYGFLRGGIR